MIYTKLYIIYITTLKFRPQKSTIISHSFFSNQKFHSCRILCHIIVVIKSREMKYKKKFITTLKAVPSLTVQKKS